MRVGAIGVEDGTIELHPCVWVVFLVPLLRATPYALAPPEVSGVVDDEAPGVILGAGV